MKVLKYTARFCNYIIPTFFYCLISRIPFDPTYQIVGRLYVLKPKFYIGKGGQLIIGKFFKANSKPNSNSVGIIQPCILNIYSANSLIKLGNNVGISGSTINATSSVIIGNNVLIGSGCIITDTDSHQLEFNDRINNTKPIPSKPITICDNVFIGARSIILKGVTIGEGSVIGAGSVVSKDVPPNTVYAGNPAKFIKNINH